MKLRHLLLGSVVAAVLPMTALAQTPNQGLYVGGQFGVNWLDDIGVAAGAVTNEWSFDNDWTGLVETGYRFANGFRLGAELGYTSHSVQDIVGGPTGRLGGTGDLAALSLMGVAYYDFNAGGKVRPFIGGGLGLLRSELDAVGPTLALGNNLNDDTDSAFAWQLGAGLGYAFSPNVELTFGYRYLAANGLDADTGRPTFDYDYSSHSVLVGLRYVFGSAPSAPPPAAPAPVAAPAPTPPPPPPPAITRNFMVFFDWDKSDLTADARQVLNNVAAAARDGSITSVQVTGHADRSGSDEYNVRLSLRRAEAVREYLVGQGLTAGQVAIDGKGESEPMVQTADGVREPSNRRAVIIFP